MVSAAIVWSTAGALQREVHSGPGTQVAGRAAFAAMSILIAIVALERRDTIRAFRALGRWGVVAIVPWALASSSFVLALNYTTVANVVLWQATAPLMAALLAWALLGERVASRTWASMALALVGVGLIVGGGVQGGALAVLLPFGMTAFFAFVIVLARYRPEVSLAPAAFVAQLLVVCVVGPFASIESASALDWTMLAALGATVAGGIVLMTVAAQRIPVSEIVIISLLEIVIAPLLVWITYSERPSRGTIVGGAVIVAGVAVQAVGDLRRREPETSAVAPKQTAGLP